MRQLHLKACYKLGIVSATAPVGLGGQGLADLAHTFGASYAKVVVPVAGTLSRLMVYAAAGTHPDYVATLVVNGVASALACHLGPAASLASDLGHTAAVAAGDDVYLAVTVTPPGSPGTPLAFSLAWEGDAQWFAVAPISGSLAIGAAWTAGALGNGIFQVGNIPSNLSMTYSMCAVPGALTSLWLKTFAGAPGAGVWTGYVTKNQVLQDGTGGTVNTACGLTGAATVAQAAFSLPVAVGDHLDVAVYRSGLAAPFANAQVALAVTFVPAVPATTMWVGGNNDAMAASAVDWKWMASEQVVGVEAAAQVPIGADGVQITGLAIEAPAAPGPGSSRIFTIRLNGQDTAATVTMSDPATSGAITGLAIPTVAGDLVDLQITPVHPPVVAGLGVKWGLALGPAAPPIPPAPPGAIEPIRRLRQAPHLWDGTSGHRLKYPGLQLLVEAGAPRDTDGPMSWVLQWSDDGGHSWSHEHRIAGSRLGEHTFRFWWRRLGQSRDRVFRVVNSDDAKIVIVDALLVPDPVEGSS